MMSSAQMIIEKHSIPYVPSSKQDTALINENQVATLHDADDDTVSIGLQMMNHKRGLLNKTKHYLQY
jgi:hypothetical protein